MLTKIPDTTKNIKSVVCNICGLLLLGGDLKRHLLQHDPNRDELKECCPYEGCKYATLQKHNILSHINSVHLKVRIKCRLQIEGKACPYAGSDQSALIRHEKSVHGYYRKQVRAALRNSKHACDLPSSSASAGSLSITPQRRSAQRAEQDDGRYLMSSDSEETLYRSNEYYNSTNFPAFVVRHGVPISKGTSSDSVQVDVDRCIAVQQDFDTCSKFIFTRVEQEKCATLGDQWSGVVSAIELLN